MSESFKWTYLSELANQLVLWWQVVLDIDKSISPHVVYEEKKSQTEDKNKQEENLKFDLKSALERCQINIEKAEKIQISSLQPIKSYLDYEVHQKLSLSVSHKLSGVITWVACIIIWYKLQDNVSNILDEELIKLKKTKESQFEKFSQIAKGQTTATTAHCATEIFNGTFKIYNERCLVDTQKNISDFLESSKIKELFDTNKVYEHIDNLYISQVDINKYENSINYVKNPVKSFEAYVNDLKTQHIVSLQQIEMQNYKNRMKESLIAFKDRLFIIYEIMNRNQEMSDDSINFFQILKDDKKYLPFDDEREEIISKMSPILLKTLEQILDGSYTVGQEKLLITINGVQTEYTVTVKPKDSKDQKIVRESALLNLQKLEYDQKQPQEFIQEFLNRLKLFQNDSKHGVCTEIRFMVGKLIDLLDAKINVIEGTTLDDIKNISHDNVINSLVTNAIGCTELCKFCNRKCESLPHQDDILKHNCEKRGHILRVFGGGCLVTTIGVTYPSLITCDEIKHDTKIRIQNSTGGSEIRLWSEIHDTKNRFWTTNYTKFQPHPHNDKINPDWKQMYEKLENFWSKLGKKYCDENKYTFIETKKFTELDQKKQFGDSAIVIICLDDSGSMFNSNNDFAKAVQGGKEVEKWLMNNHLKKSEVHIQLWFNDCSGVNLLHKGQLTSQIPSNLWNRTGCQGDSEISRKVNIDYGPCGQFTGAVRILNQEVNSLLKTKDYKDVYWFFFTDGGNTYPNDELNILQDKLKTNRQIWTNNGAPKLHPLIITNQLTVQSLCQMKQRIDQIVKEIWQVEDICALKQNVQTDKMGETMIEQFTFN